MQLALYQRFYCRVARGWAWVVKVMVMEHLRARMAPDVPPFRQLLTVNMDNMVKQLPMAALMDMTDVRAADMVSQAVMAKVTARVHMVRADLVRA